MCWPTICEHRKTPVCMTPIDAFQSSSERVSDGPISARPALLTRMSIRPCAARTSATAAWTAARELTSQACPVPPSRAAVSAAAAPSRSRIAVVAPSAANRVAMASPMPRAPPVMTAIRSASFIHLPPSFRRPAPAGAYPWCAICYSVLVEPCQMRPPRRAARAPDPRGGSVEPACRQPEQSVVSERITMPPPVPRLQRVAEWMTARDLDALVVTGPALVTWITGYSRYYGGPAAAVLTPAGERTLVVLRDEVAVAEQMSAAQAVVGFSERGFGLELNPIPLLVDEVLKVGAVAAAGRIGVAGDFGAAVAAAATVPACRGRRRAARDEPGQGRRRADQDLPQLRAVLAGSRRGGRGHRGRAPPRSRCSAPRTHAAQVGYGSPVEFGADLLAGRNTAEVCAPVAIAGPGRAGPGEPVVADLSVGADGYWADTCRTYVERPQRRGRRDPRPALRDHGRRGRGPAHRRQRRRRLRRHLRPDRGGVAGRRVPASRRRTASGSACSMTRT